MRRAAIVVLLAGMWAALWRDASPGTFVGGLLAGAVVVTVVPEVRAAAWRPVVRPLATVHFLAAFTANLVRATGLVAWDVVTPTLHAREGIIAVPLRTRSTPIVTLVANAISLTPGTVTVDVAQEPTTLYIHVMHLSDVEAARAEVQRLEELALRAFASPDERDELTRGGRS